MTKLLSILGTFGLGLCLVFSPTKTDAFELGRHSIREDANSDKEDEPSLPTDVEPWWVTMHDSKILAGSGDGAFVVVFLWGLTSPFWLPPILLGDEYNIDPEFLDYPYQDGARGTLNYKNRMTDAHSGKTGDWWRGQLRTDYGNDFDDLQSIGGQLILETQSRFGIDSEFKYRHESMANGSNNQLWTGDANFVFRFAQSEAAEMRIGAGFNWLSDQTDSDFGFNFTYGLDWFLKDPWVLSSVMDAGGLGGKDLFHFRTTLGCQLRRAELYTGFDYYNVGGVAYDGFIAGVGLRF